MREIREFPESVTIPVLPVAKEIALPAPKKSGRKSALKRADVRNSALARQAGRRNVRQLPTRQMNNRGGR